MPTETITLVAKYKELITLIFLIIFGSVTNAIVYLKTNRDKEKITSPIDMLIAFFIASFSGTMAGIGAGFLTNDPAYIGASAAMFSFMGLRGVNFLVDTLLSVAISKIGGAKDGGRDT